MAEQLNAVRGVDGQQTRAMAQTLTRVVVLPFRVLRPDPETDFLAFSLPDAITTSLAGIRIADRAIERDRRALCAATRRTSGRSPRRPTSIAWSPARSCARAISCARRPNWSKRPAARSSRRTPCRRRSAISSGCRTTSRGAWWTGSRCRWPASACRRLRMRRTMRMPTSSTSGPTGWRATTTGWRRPGRCTSSASRSIRPLRRRGRTWAAAIG